jgi:DNA-binding cell septation regulator SpoVG
MRKIMKITEINLVPVKPRNGLVAFASIVVDNSLYLGSIAVYSKLDGSYRLLYPTKITGKRPINFFHPINRVTSRQIEEAIFEKCNEIFEKGIDENDRHYKAGGYFTKAS